MSSVCLRSWNSPSGKDEYTYSIHKEKQARQDAALLKTDSWNPDSMLMHVQTLAHTVTCSIKQSI